ncbi:hypothetical protein [Rhodococcus sp. BS-15]|uniref:hypothetical protein n=1 Tax=Rhodococcus sp. BS-15 TaxID=1304954 RepID=UPI000A3F6D76|nr:hypothetical protein [Rhodococcus sp. BS-15]
MDAESRIEAVRAELIRQNESAQQWRDAYGDGDGVATIQRTTIVAVGRALDGLAPDERVQWLPDW